MKRRKHLRHVDRAIERSATALLLPPYAGIPPGHHRAIGAQRGKGSDVENTCVTSIVPSSAAATALLSPP
ncbi:MAG: hypothetical protein V5B38_00990 [Candidatus Accumulibacter propinquus]